MNRLLKSVDMYANPILLTFKQKRHHPTVCGGILSLITILVLLFWVSDALFKVFDKKYTTSTTQKLTNEGAVENP